ncbi:hypothetical protein Droror1_Dr00013442 [Drosera rotundifolia]
MATRDDHGIRAQRCLVFLVAIWLKSSLAQGRRDVSVKLAKAPDGTVRTFKGDDGDVIDCVVFHKQPAFKHPRLHNHKIQMEPSSYPNGLRLSNQITNELMQPWHAKGECPAGTVPIKRPLSNSPKTKRRDRDRIDMINEVLNPHQYAVVHYPGFNGSIHGTSGTYSVWNPWVARGEDYSVAQMWVIAGTGDDLNTIEAGWHVNPELTGGYKTKFFTYWTSDHYELSGCYNLECPGFVQVSKVFAVGAALPVSTYQGPQVERNITLDLDSESENWWLYVEGNPIGYFPSELFTNLCYGADRVDWGGQIYDSTGTLGTQTMTQMGSGHIASEGFGKASYISGLTIRTFDSTELATSVLHKTVTAPSCYSLQQSDDVVYFGGPGCPYG